MEKYVFKIRNLTKVFNDKIAISVPYLDIERGKLIFLLGNSGCGKSTFLETLGMMSQAYDKDDQKSQIVFYPEPDSVPYDYNHLWVDEDKLNKVRLENLSFLFQQTNFFPQFTLRENISIAKVMQNTPIESEELKCSVLKKVRQLNIIPNSGHNIEKQSDGKSDYPAAKAEEDNAGDKLACTPTEDEEKKLSDNPKNLSGGQKQRAAFARASLKDFSVLFADEPTGNLGKEDAQNLIGDIRNLIDKDPDKYTAIVVSHDIDLALEYADSIIIMSKDGYLDKKNKFFSTYENGKRSWSDFGDDSEHWKSAVQDLMNIEYGDEKKKILDSSPIPTKNDYPSIPSNYDKEFKKFYHSKKFEDLSLKKFTGVVLMLVLAIVWLAIGFSKGSLEYLERKMSDPFIKWLNVDVPKAEQEQIPIIMDSLKSTHVSKKYFVQSVTGFNKFALYFWDENRKGEFVAFGRNIRTDDPILEKIVSPENLIRGRKFNKEKDFGLIISESFLNNFYKNPDKNLFVKLSVRTNLGEYLVPIPIVGVVKDLPMKDDFITTTFFYDQIFYAPTNPFNPESTKEVSILIFGDEDNAWCASDSISSFFQKHQEFSKLQPYVSRPVKYEECYKNGFTINISFTSELSISELNKISDHIIKSPEMKTISAHPVYNFNFTNTQRQTNYDKISINVSNLDNVAELKDYLLNRFNLEIDMARIEALKNYNFISKLTQILSLALIFISIISVSIFVSYILYVHLYKNRVYIGSFTAFGITDQTMQRIYLRRMTILVLSALGLSLVFAAFLGYTGILKNFLSLFTLFEGQHLFFNLVSYYPLIFVSFMLGVSYYSMYRTAKYFLDHSPGDLIYDRIGNDRTSPPVHIMLVELGMKKSIYHKFILWLYYYRNRKSKMAGA